MASSLKDAARYVAVVFWSFVFPTIIFITIIRRCSNVTRAH